MMGGNDHVPRRQEAARTLLSEGEVRRFEPDDIPRVAALFERAFNPSGGEPSERLCDYFEELFFKTPWLDPLVPSWVYETNQGLLKAFIGIHPRRMLFDQKPIICAALGQWCVSEDYRGRGLGSLMVYHSLQMGPILSFGDTNVPLGHPARGQWERCGGARLLVAGIQWEFSLRGKASGSVGQTILQFPRRMSDHVRLRRRRLRINPLLEGTVLSNLDPSVLLRLPEMLSPEVRFYPQYDARYASWLIKVASDTSSRGALKHAAVHSCDGDGIDGWYFFYLSETGKAEVLQSVSKPGAERRVLAQLIAHADRENATSVMGQWSSQEATVAAQEIGCYLGYVPSLSTIFTKDFELMRTIMSGRYFMSAFEGDSWLDFVNR